MEDIIGNITKEYKDRFGTLSIEEYILINKIAIRAVNDFGFTDLIGLSLDLEYIHAKNPLLLNDLLNASAGNFAHDMCGINRHFNRETKSLDNNFLPRFSV